jgi:hypothetical protein
MVVPAPSIVTNVVTQIGISRRAYMVAERYELFGGMFVAMGDGTPADYCGPVVRFTADDAACKGSIVLRLVLDLWTA